MADKFLSPALAAEEWWEKTLNAISVDQREAVNAWVQRRLVAVRRAAEDRGYFEGYQDGLRDGRRRGNA